MADHLLAEHAIEGYFVCQCGALVPEAVGNITRRLCPACFEAIGDRRKTVEIIERGRSLTLPARPAKKMRRHRGSRGSRATMRLAGSARDAALLKLKWLHRDDYERLYNEERVARGMLPVPRQSETFATPVAYGGLSDDSGAEQ